MQSWKLLWLRSIVLKDLRRLLRRVRLRRRAKIEMFPRRVLNCLLKIPPKKLLKKLLVGAVHRRGAETKSIDARQIDHPPLYQRINHNNTLWSPHTGAVRLTGVGTLRETDALLRSVPSPPPPGRSRLRKNAARPGAAPPGWGHNAVGCPLDVWWHL